MTPLHLYPLCENCGATILPSSAGFSCDHVCGASRVAPEALTGVLPELPGASASGLFGRRARFSFKLTQSIRARTSSKTRSVAKLSRVHEAGKFDEAAA